MKILSFKPGHDGSISYIKDSKLIFSHEAEKGSGFRYCNITTECIIEALSTINDAPDIIALSGCHPVIIHMVMILVPVTLG